MMVVFALPNVEGNRPAAQMVTEDQGVCRRVRLIVRLGVSDPDALRIDDPRLSVSSFCACEA